MTPKDQAPPAEPAAPAVDADLLARHARMWRAHAEDLQRKAAAHPLRYLFLEITRRCNLACAYCGSPPVTATMMPFASKSAATWRTTRTHSSLVSSVADSRPVQDDPQYAQARLQRRVISRNR